MKGGKVIGAGTFGCVFNPPLKCKDNKDKNYQVSKLLKLKDLHEEVDQTDKIHKHISILFIFKYVFCLGFLDGKSGLAYCISHNLIYRIMVDIRIITGDMHYQNNIKHKILE